MCIRGRLVSACMSRRWSLVDAAMPGTVEALILDLLDWVSSKERTYDQVMDAWRTSCPRLPVWEDANDLGFLETHSVSGRSIVRVTASGLAFLQQRRTCRK
jgi:hypothetical protein